MLKRILSLINKRYEKCGIFYITLKIHRYFSTFIYVGVLFRVKCLRKVLCLCSTEPLFHGYIKIIFSSRFSQLLQYKKLNYSSFLIGFKCVFFIYFIKTNISRFLNLVIQPVSEHGICKEEPETLFFVVKAIKTYGIQNKRNSYTSYKRKFV